MLDARMEDWLDVDGTDHSKVLKLKDSLQSQVFNIYWGLA